MNNLKRSTFHSCLNSKYTLLMNRADSDLSSLLQGAIWNPQENRINEFPFSFDITSSIYIGSLDDCSLIHRTFKGAYRYVWWSCDRSFLGLNGLISEVTVDWYNNKNNKRVIKPIRRFK